MYVSPVLYLKNPEQQLIVAEQEKAIARENFELARHRLMNATALVNNIKAKIYYSGKEANNGKRSS